MAHYISPPTDGTSWAEVRLYGTDQVLGHVTIPVDGLYADYNQFTARAVVNGNFKYCTSYRFDKQVHAALWVARNAWPCDPDTL